MHKTERKKTESLVCLTESKDVSLAQATAILQEVDLVVQIVICQEVSK